MDPEIAFENGYLLFSYPSRWTGYIGKFYSANWWDLFPQVNCCQLFFSHAFCVTLIPRSSLYHAWQNGLLSMRKLRPLLTFLWSWDTSSRCLYARSIARRAFYPLVSYFKVVSKSAPCRPAMTNIWLVITCENRSFDSKLFSLNCCSLPDRFF